MHLRCPFFPLLSGRQRKSSGHWPCCGQQWPGSRWRKTWPLWEGYISESGQWGCAWIIDLACRGLKGSLLDQLCSGTKNHMDLFYVWVAWFRVSCQGHSPCLEQQSRRWRCTYSTVEAGLGSAKKSPDCDLIQLFELCYLLHARSYFGYLSLSFPS